MRLSAEVLLRAESYLNPIKERELYLRGFKISAIENLSVLQDQFDVIDFSDNEIRLLDNFPRMRRLTTLFLNNNYIFRIGEIGGNLCNLTTLVMTNNRISNLSDIDNLASLTQLELLSLMDNPLTNHVHYRLYVIHKIPSLKCLDFQKVTRDEREQSRRLFASEEGVSILSAMENEKTNESLTSSSSSPAQTSSSSTFTDEQKDYIRSAIEAAQTKEEMDRIELQLRSGTFSFPSNVANHSSGSGNGSSS